MGVKYFVYGYKKYKNDNFFQLFVSETQEDAKVYLKLLKFSKFYTFV